MEKFVRGFCLFLVDFLFVSALVCAAPAGMGDRPATPGVNILFDKDAFGIPGSQAGPAWSGKTSRLSLRLSGGYSYTSTADVSDGVSYFFALATAWEAQGLGRMTGGYNPLHSGFDFGADLVYQITRSVGVGFGAGYLRISANSAGTYTEDTLSLDLSSQAMVSAIPLRLGVFLTVPLSPKLDLAASAGTAYYAGLRMDASFGSEGGGSYYTTDYIGRQRSSVDIGFHGSLGLEYGFSPAIGFFVEVLGRYAEFWNFKMVTHVYDIGAGPQTGEGTLYLGSSMSSPELRRFLSGNMGGGWTYREPKFDLSGFSLRLGLRIRL